jgi:hypothetical protein
VGGGSEKRRLNPLVGEFVRGNFLIVGVVRH